MKIVLNNIRSAWNVGAIMRTCDAIGAELILIGYTPRPEGKTMKLIKKTAIGAEEIVKWEHFEHFNQVLNKYNDNLNIGIEISKTSENIFEYLRTQNPEKNQKTLLWFGNEIHGLEPDLTKQLDYELHLPMTGIKESLNVASVVCTVGYLFLEHSPSKSKTADKTSS